MRCRRSRGDDSGIPLPSTVQDCLGKASWLRGRPARVTSCAAAINSRGVCVQGRTIWRQGLDAHRHADMARPTVWLGRRSVLTFGRVGRRTRWTGDRSRSSTDRRVRALEVLPAASTEPYANARSCRRAGDYGQSAPGSCLSLSDRAVTSTSVPLPVSSLLGRRVRQEGQFRGCARRGARR